MSVGPYADVAAIVPCDDVARLLRVAERCHVGLVRQGALVNACEQLARLHIRYMDRHRAPAVRCSHALVAPLLHDRAGCGRRRGGHAAQRVRRPRAEHGG